MAGTTGLTRALTIGLQIAVIAGVGCVALILAMSAHLAAFLVVAAIGGAVLATMLYKDEVPRVESTSHDPFARDVFAADSLNLAHVRVAGVGGAGLLLVSFFVALQYQLLTAALIAGVCGGLMWASALISYRRRHPAAIGRRR